MKIKVKQCCLGRNQECRFTADIGDVVLIKEREGVFFEARIKLITSSEEIVVSSLADKSETTVAEADIVALMLGD